MMPSPRRFSTAFLFFAAASLLPRIACAESLKIGSISASPVVETRKFWPLASYLAGQLRAEGIDDGKVVVAESIPAMASLVQAKQIDVYIDSVFPSLAVNHLAGGRLLLRRWKMGKSDYRSIVFTRKDGGVGALENLKGKMVAFEEPFSSSGYFLPKVELTKMKFRLTPKASASDAVRPDEVGYVFTQGDTNTIFLVLNGVVAAGAVDDQRYLAFAKNLGRFKMLHQTALFPRQLVSCRADLPAKLAARIQEILLTMDRSAEGAKVLREFEATAKFDEIPPEAAALIAGLKKYLDAELKLQQ